MSLLQKVNLEVQKYRLKRHSRQISFDLLKASALLGAVGSLAAAMIWAYAFILSSPYFQIRETVVRGCKELTEKDVLAVAALPSGANLLAFNLEKTARAIRRNPWIKEVFVGRELPDRIVIEVRERQPIAVLKQQDGLFLVDREGLRFKRVEQADDVDLPVLTGAEGSSETEQALFAQSLVLLNFLGRMQTFPSPAEVSEVHRDTVMGLSLFTTNGLCLKLGFDGFETKLRRLSAVLEDLEKRNQRTGLTSIDLSDPAKVNVRRRGGVVTVETPAAPKGLKT